MRLFSNGRKTRKVDIQKSLHEFSIAEYSSAIEMLYAAKSQVNKDPAMAMGFIRHALDEFKHTQLFRNIIDDLRKSNEIDKVDTRFTPNMVITMGYIDPGNFLFNKFSLNRFSTFIGVNERAAHRLFKKIRIRLNETKALSLTEEECEKFKEYLDIILADEERHAEYAFRYCQKHISKRKLKITMIWEYFCTKSRAIYASQGRINKCIASVIYLFVILLMYPFRFAIYFPQRANTDLINSSRNKFMI